MTDPIADFLTRIRNGCMAAKEEVFIPFSKLKSDMCRILQEEGYIWSYEVDTEETHPRLKVKLKYDGRDPVIKKLGRISKPGLRKYVSVNEIPRILGGLGISILSTSRGLMTGHKAKKANVGGELLAFVY